MYCRYDQALASLFIFFGLSLLSLVANAAVIRFDTPELEFQQSFGESTPYLESGFRIDVTSEPNTFGSLIRINPDAQFALTPNNGSVHASVSRFTTIVLSQEQNAHFDLLSLDLAEFSEFAANASEVVLIGTHVDTTQTTTTLLLDQVFDGAGSGDDFQTFLLNWENLVSVAFHAELFSVDNINVSVSQVPLPGTLILFLSALTGFRASTFFKDIRTDNA